MYAGLQMGGFAEEFIQRAYAMPDSIYGRSRVLGFDGAMRERRERAQAELGSLKRIR